MCRSKHASLSRPARLRHISHQPTKGSCLSEKLDSDSNAPVSPERVDGYWLVLEYPNNPTIRLDARVLDRIFVDDGELVVSVDETAIRISISGGEHVAMVIAEQLGP